MSFLFTRQAILCPTACATAWLAIQSANAQAPTAKPLSSGLVRIEAAAPTRGPWGEWHRYFRGDTHGAKDLIVLVVNLKPGQEPHPPHRHAEEEIMILTEGTGTWHLDGKEFPARKGDVVYAAPWSMHGVKNTGEGPLSYFMVKWSGKGVAAPAKPMASDEKEATLARIRELGGRYLRDLDLPNSPVVKVDFRDTAVREDDLQILTALKGVREQGPPRWQRISHSAATAGRISDDRLHAVAEHRRLEFVRERALRRRDDGAGVEDFLRHTL